MSGVLYKAGARAILDAAATLFAENGFEAVSIASIAESAGMCKANVFRYFASKEDLYAAVMKEASSAHADYAEELCKSPSRSADKVRMLIEFEIRYMLENEQRTRLLLNAVSACGHSRVRKLARSVFQRNFSAVVSIFEQGQARGEFRASMNCAAAAMVLSGAAQCFLNCRDALQEFRKADDLESPEVYAEHVVAVILAGALQP